MQHTVRQCKSLCMTASSIDKRHAFNIAKSFMSNLAHGQYHTLLLIGQQLEDIANACKCNKYPQIANEKAQSGAVTLLTCPNQNFWPARHDSLQDISVSDDAQGPKHHHQRDLCSNVWASTDATRHLFASITSRP